MNALPLEVTLSRHILASCRQRGQDNVKMELKEDTVGIGKILDFSEHRVQWHAVMKPAMNTRVIYKTAGALTSRNSASQ
jgi:hypothetical protein